MEENNNSNENDINEVRPDASIEPYIPVVDPTPVNPTINEEIINPVKEEETINPINPVPSVAPVSPLPPLPEIGSASPVVEEKKKSKAPIIIVIVLVLVAIIAILMFVLKKKPADTSTPSNDNTQETNNNDNNNNVAPVTSGTLSIVVGGQVTTRKSQVVSTISKTFGKEVSVADLDKGTENTSNNIKYLSTSVLTNDKKYNIVYPVNNADFIKSSLLNADSIDGAIIVVAASEGVMPQTREHIRVLSQIGVSRLVVFIDTEGVDDNSLIDLIEMEMRELVQEYGFSSDATPVVRGSASDENAIKDLMNNVGNWINKDVEVQNESATSHKKFKASTYLLSKEEGGRHTALLNDFKPVFVFNNKDIDGTGRFDVGYEMALPGDNFDMIVELNSATNMKKGTKFTFKEDGKTIGVGVVSEVLD